MNQYQEVLVLWTPHAKQRPRVTKGGVAYTSKATRQAESEIRRQFDDAIVTEWAPFAEPISVELLLANDHFHLAVQPMADYENRRLRGDVDNYAKTILDALNHRAWEDDKWIRSLTVTKL